MKGSWEGNKDKRELEREGREETGKGEEKGLGKGWKRREDGADKIGRDKIGRDKIKRSKERPKKEREKMEAEKMKKNMNMGEGGDKNGVEYVLRELHERKLRNYVEKETGYWKRKEDQRLRTEEVNRVGIGVKEAIIMNINGCMKDTDR